MSRNIIKIFQTYFDENSYRFMDPAFFPIKNELKDGFFENSVIKKIFHADNTEINYLGVTSWKQKQKTNLTGKEIIDFIQKDIVSTNEKDVYIYCPPPLEISYDNAAPPVLRGFIKAPDLWTQHKTWGVHPFDADKLLNDSGVLPFDMFDGKWVFCHNNYFIAKTAVFNEYCKTVLLPFMEFFERPDIKTHPASVAWYPHSSGNKYPSYSFVGEGLFGSFLAHSNYTYSYICKKRIHKKFKMVRVDTK